MAVVELAQPLDAGSFTSGNAVKVLFHLSRKFVFDKMSEVGFKKCDDCKAKEGRNQRTSTLDDVSALLNNLNGCRESRRTTNS